MDQPAAPQTSFKKPIGGFIVVLVAAVLIGGWLYVDGVKNELEMKVDGLESRLEAERMKAAKDAEKEEPPPPVAEKEYQTYAAALGEYRFQVDLPEGYHLSIQEGGMGDLGAYVLLDSTPENEAPTPDMFISLVSLGSESYASMVGNEEPGTRIVPAPDGKFAFFIRGWEDQEWPEFEMVAASFKAL